MIEYRWIPQFYPKRSPALGLLASRGAFCDLRQVLRAAFLQRLNFLGSPQTKRLTCGGTIDGMEY